MVLAGQGRSPSEVQGSRYTTAVNLQPTTPSCQAATYPLLVSPPRYTNHVINPQFVSLQSSIMNLVERHSPSLRQPGLPCSSSVADFHYQVQQDSSRAEAQVFIFVSALEDQYLPLQEQVFAKVYYSKAWSRDGMTSFNIRLI